MVTEPAGNYDWLSLTAKPHNLVWEKSLVNIISSQIEEIYKTVGELQ